MAFDYLPTVISQYANSPVMLRLIEDFRDYIDPTARLDQFYTLMWNVDTAQGYGLDVWGRIVGVNRVLLVADGDYATFEETGDDGSFGEYPFYTGQTTTSNYYLSDDAFRRLILAKALANITDSSIPAINRILMALFPDHGNCYVADNEDMTLTYTFGAPLTPVDASIVYQSGVLPKPLGVTAAVDAP